MVTLRKKYINSMDQIFRFWLKPKVTIELLDKDNSQKLKQKVNFIFALIAILFSLQGYCSLDFSANADKALKAMYSILSIPAVFLIVKFFYSFLLLIISKLFHGDSTGSQIRTVLAFSMSPFLVFLPYIVFQFFAFLILPNTSIDSSFTLSIEKIFGIVSFCYLIIGLTRVNKFSPGYGLAVAILTPTLIELLSLLIKS